MKTCHLLSVVLASAMGFAACGDDGGSSDDGGIFEPEAECEGQAITPLQGGQAMIFSKLNIGKAEDGFDFDGDGMPDNKFAGVSSLAAEPIEDSLKNFELVLPLELFDVDALGEDECVKLAVYQGEYLRDSDDDGERTAKDGGDCNDNLASVGPGQEEVPDNGIDDDCDGLADEVIVKGKNGPEESPSTDTSDADDDGVTIADGDCDDTNDAVAPGQAEVCGDGLDNDCDGVADWTEGAETPACSPFDDDLDPISVLDNSFDQNGEPFIAFQSATITREEGVLKLRTAPSDFRLVLPVVDDVELELRITGTIIEGDLVETAGGWAIENGRLGGVMDTYSMDQIRGLEVDEIMLKPEDSLADAVYANVLGVLLGLRRGEAGTPGAGCFTPDIDVDGDGLEAFCDSEPEDEDTTIDTCVDGDNTVVLDEGETQCSEATDDEGNLRFVDGISIALTFETVPAALPESL